LRILRENNYKNELLLKGDLAGLSSMGASDSECTSNFLVLKTDLLHIIQLNHESQILVANDLKSVIKAPNSRKTIDDSVSAVSLTGTGNSS
jgi:hypothetical protein